MMCTFSIFFKNSVVRVDQLMVLCDELKAKLNQSHTDGAKLMEAMVAEMVGV